MDYREFNLTISKFIHTLIRLDIIDEKDVGHHYALHSYLFNYWQPIMEEHEKELYKTNGPECPPK